MTQTQQELQRFQRDVEYFDAHYQAFLERYPEQWVAVYNQEVVGTGPRFRPLLKALEKKGIPLGKVVIERVTREAEVWILATA